MSRGPFWTATENARLRATYRILGSAALAAELNRTRRAVEIQAARLGITKRDPATSRIRAFFDANPDEWLSIEDIAVKFGMTKLSAKKYAGRAGLERVSVYRKPQGSGGARP